MQFSKIFFLMALLLVLEFSWGLSSLWALTPQEKAQLTLISNEFKQQVVQLKAQVLLSSNNSASLQSQVQILEKQAQDLQSQVNEGLTSAQTLREQASDLEKSVTNFTSLLQGIETENTLLKLGLGATVIIAVVEATAYLLKK